MRFHFLFWFPYRHQHTYLTDGSRFCFFDLLPLLATFHHKRCTESACKCGICRPCTTAAHSRPSQRKFTYIFTTLRSHQSSRSFTRLFTVPAPALRCSLRDKQRWRRGKRLKTFFFFFFFFFNCVSLLAQSGTGWALCVPFFQVYFNPHRRKRRSWSKFKVTSADPYKKFFISVENHPKKTFPR